MSDFKDAVASDIDDVFLNADEFADEHIIDGVDARCVIDNIDTQGDGVSDRYGTFATSIRVHIKEELITTPVENEILSIDGYDFTVTRVSREVGMLVIEARRFDQ